MGELFTRLVDVFLNVEAVIASIIDTPAKRLYAFDGL
jgi:hypothetical protein